LHVLQAELPEFVEALTKEEKGIGDKDMPDLMRVKEVIETARPQSLRQTRNKEKHLSTRR